MKLATFEANGKVSYGAVVDGGIVDLGKKLSFADLRALIAGNGFAQAKAAIAGAKPDVALNQVRLLPVIPNPDKIICVGLNYEDHVVETKRERTEDPALFVRFANSQMGHNEPMLLPPESSHLDYEGEIAVIIGKGGRRIAEKDAYGHVAGFSCYNDGSIRDLQWATTQWTTGKNFPSTGAFGPWMVTTDEVPADSVLTLITRLNGQEMQRATTQMMIHSIPRLIAFISVFTELAPGDVIVSGTPGGVGGRKKPPLFMKDGDVCEIEIDKVGVLSNPIKAEKV
ncbi:MAG: 5-carboxymethyl-2-hydroxymuconate isomerase [Rhizobiales bacterium 62-17]|mgnify:CR=1 FL=1|nr:fumarylacetoacetate hydrolase family protein [Hyphomicrobiales bacterium]OJY00219.1 MAG: 5-carboxymethyl-2-hydroxymuconate isomerase [Rhizobiales bacterium 62-17]